VLIGPNYVDVPPPFHLRTEGDPVPEICSREWTKPISGVNSKDIILLCKVINYLHSKTIKCFKEL